MTTFRFLRKVLSSAHGMSMTELLIAAGVAGGLGMTVTKLMENSTKSSKSMEADFNVQGLHEEIRRNLANEDAGTATFLNKDLTTCTGASTATAPAACQITVIKNKNNVTVSRFTPGTYSASGTQGENSGSVINNIMEIDSAWISGWVENSNLNKGTFNLNIRYENLGSGRRSVGTRFLTKQIVINARVTASNLVTRAAAEAGGNDTQWLDIADLSGIYYPSGGVRVGIDGNVYNGPALSVGINTLATGNKSIAFGSNATASGSNSLVVGENVSATQAGGVVLADSNTTAISNTTTNSFLSRFYNGYSFYTDPNWSPILYINSATNASTGLVGINTTSPLAGLHIVTTGAPRGLRISGAGATNYTETQLAGDGREYRFGVGGSSATTYGVQNKFYIWDRPTNTMRMTIDTNGNIGIGTTGPAALLDIYQSSNGIVNSRIKNDNTGATAETRVTLDNGTVYSALELYGSGYGGGYANYLNLFNSGAYPITFSTNGSERMRVHGNGNVGIGSTNPSYKLVVNSQGNTGTTSTALHGQYYGPVISSEQTSSSYYALNITNGATANTPGSGSSIFYVRTDGNVGIGTASPSSPLHIYKGGQTIQLGTGTNTSGYALNIGVNDAGVNISNNSSIRNFYFKTAYQAAPAAYITSHGMINALLTFRVAGFDVCWSNGCTIRVSDKRFKEKIAPLGSSLENVMKLRPVSYEWKDKKTFGKDKQVGFIAQEIEEVYPELIKVQEDKKMKAVDYTALTSPIISVIKDIREKIMAFIRADSSHERELASLQLRLKEEQKKKENTKRRLEKLEAKLKNN